jgi:hypothetical protein
MNADSTRHSDTGSSHLPSETTLRANPDGEAPVDLAPNGTRNMQS